VVISITIILALDDMESFFGMAFRKIGLDVRICIYPQRGLYALDLYEES